ncbi:MAG TPA: ABC transporter ATP-binding protein [Candidatus Kapabacteria bacterium]|nr:ABC transporter ATP-binding protein [Candidatus Kapabacteria bacterium]
MPEPSSTPIEHPVPLRSGDVAVHAEGITKRFGDGPRALDDAGLTLYRGELVALIGANGSGKSTLLKLLFGVLQPDAGSIEVLGLRPHADGGALRAAAGYAPQDAALDPEITGWETLRLFHALRGLPGHRREAQLAAIVAEYDLAPFCNRPVGTYSGGQRQRLHLALETMHSPSLLLLDEPTASLDPSARRALWGRLASRRDAGNTIVVATHDLADVAANCDRVVLLHHGKVLACAAPGALTALHGGACTIITLSDAPGKAAAGLRSGLMALPGSMDVTMEGATIIIWREHHPETGEPALDLLAELGLACRRYERQEADLAAAYFRITGSALPMPERTALRGNGRGGRGRGDAGNREGNGGRNSGGRNSGGREGR